MKAKHFTVLTTS